MDVSSEEEKEQDGKKVRGCALIGCSTIVVILVIVFLVGVLTGDEVVNEHCREQLEEHFVRDAAGDVTIIHGKTLMETAPAYFGCDLAVSISDPPFKYLPDSNVPAFIEYLNDNGYEVIGNIDRVGGNAVVVSPHWQGTSPTCFAIVDALRDEKYAFETLQTSQQSLAQIKSQGLPAHVVGQAVAAAQAVEHRYTIVTHRLEQARTNHEMSGDPPCGF